jgi:hypothetical protein
MRKWKQFLAITALVLGIGVIMVPASTASAIDILSPGCKGNSGSTVCKSKNDKAPSLVTDLINTLLLVLGMVAVIMIVVGGIRYTTSGGDSSGIKTAKDTILYSVVGLILAILSYTIVKFVIGKF